MRFQFCIRAAGLGLLALSSAAAKVGAQQIVGWSTLRYAAADPARLPAGACEMPKTTAAAAGIKQRALDSLVALAGAAHSDALVVLADGKLVGEWTFGHADGLLDAMSVTKLFSSLAIGRLITTGRLASIDMPVSDIFPEWRQGKKRAITIRHVLSHSTGLENVPNSGVEIEPAPSHLALALASELDHDPGTVVSYNNKAVALLGGIVHRLTGLTLDAYVRRELLDPMCFGESEWLHDPSGDAMAMAGARLRARDLAKVGQLMLDGGSWRGVPLLSRQWVDSSTVPSQSINPRIGLLWLLRPTAFFHSGSFGQYLVVLPRERIVVVRMITRRDGAPESDQMPGFESLVATLFGRDVQGIGTKVP